MNSSMAEQLPVKQQVESSNLSSSAKGGSITRIKERVRSVEEAVLKTVGPYQAQGFDSLPLRNNMESWQSGMAPAC